MEISKNIDLESAARKQQETNVDKHLMDEVGLLRDLCDQVCDLCLGCGSWFCVHQVRNKREALELGFKEKVPSQTHL